MEIERVQSDPTAYWWYFGVTVSDVAAALATNDARIVDLQVESVSDAGPVLTVAMVANSGPYAKEWWWWFGQSADEVGETLESLNARLISISPYQDGDALLFATVMVANSGADAKEWWWYYGSIDSIAASLAPLNARVVDLEPYSFNGSTGYVVIAISNKGADASAWWWYYNVPATTISNVVSQNNGMLLTFVNDGSGFDASIQAPATNEWWYYFGLSAELIGQLLDQNGARPGMVRSYNGNTAFNVVMINNSNALTTRVGNILRTYGGGWTGFYLKEVNGPVLGALNDAFVFEPASAIKIVMAVYAMTQVQQGNLTLLDWMPEFDPHNFCAFQQLTLGIADGVTTTFTGSLPQNYGEPIDAGSVKVTAGTISAEDNGGGQMAGSGVSGTIDYTTGSVTLTFEVPPATGTQLLVYETLQAAIKQMMWNSDNARADMFIHQFGPTTLTSFAQSLGMINTEVNWYVDCSGGQHNHLTLDDAGHLYEGLANGTILNWTTAQTLFGLMAGKQYDFSGIWGSLQTMINEINSAASNSVSAAQLQAFIDGIQLSYKPGGYTYGPTSVDPDGSSAYSDTGLDGWIEIPFCDGDEQSSKQYVFGFFVECTSPTGSQAWAQMGAGAEILREQVTASLATWAQCG